MFQYGSDDEVRHVELSVSFSARSFPGNVVRAFDVALRLAARLGARVFEETVGREVNEENVDEVLDAEGAYLQGLVSFWRSGRERLISEFRAALEVPLGAIDTVTDFFAFQLPTGATPPPPLAELTADTPTHLRAHVFEQSAVLVDVEKDDGVVRIIRLEDKVWVRPFWSDLPFATLAAETLAALGRVAARMPTATPHTLDAPLDAARLESIASHSRGLAVEYFEWAARPPTPPA